MPSGPSIDVFVDELDQANFGFVGARLFVNGSIHLCRGWFLSLAVSALLGTEPQPWQAFGST
jgi:hypothetical protein